MYQMIKGWANGTKMICDVWDVGMSLAVTFTPLRIIDLLFERGESFRSNLDPPRVASDRND